MADLNPTEPMNTLDDQVRRFTSEALERPGVVTGWVLCVKLIASRKVSE